MDDTSFAIDQKLSAIGFYDLMVALEKNEDADQVENGEDGEQKLSKASEGWRGDEVGDVCKEIGEPDSCGDREPLRATTPEQ
jgi:hypothetical protein